jgi:hypothetical protein
MAWGLDASNVSDNGHTVGAAVGNTPMERRRAVRVVAANAADAAECVMVLEALGLVAAEGRVEGGEAA